MIPALIAAVFTLMVIGVALAVGTYMLWAGERIFPGTELFGIDLGGRTSTEVNAILSLYWEEQRITLDAETNQWSASPAELGIRFNPEATTKRAHSQGRTLESLMQIIGDGGRVRLTPVWEFDVTEAEANLSAYAGQIFQPPINASLRILNGAVEQRAAVDGRRLDLEATLAALTADPAKALVEGRLTLVTAPLPAAVTDISGLAQQASQLLNRTLTLHVYDPVRDQTHSGQLTPDLWSGWLSLNLDSESSEFQWQLDRELAEPYFADHLRSIDPSYYLDYETALPAIKEAISGSQETLGLRVYHYPSQHQVQSGDTFSSIGRQYGIPYPWIQQANPGVGDSLSVGQWVTIPSPDDLLPLPIVDGKRVIISISQQRMWAYENGGLKWEWLVSTGIESSPTTPGVFQIQSHEANAYAASWDLWMPYFMGIYQPVPTAAFMNGFHGFPTRDGSNLLWTGNLGGPVTYGCILLSNTNAALLYDWAEEGVIVEVQP